MISAENKIKVGVIFGGRSGEHEVSLVSASSVIRALDKEKYEIIPIGITKDGKWIAGDNSIQMLKNGQIPPKLKAVLPADPTSNELMVINTEDGDLSLHTPAIDVIIPVLHGPYGEDGTIQGLLEMTGIPYIGAGVLGSAVCMDKDVQKKLCKYAGIPVVNYVSISMESAPEVVHILHEQNISYPCFVKPANLGSSVAIHKAHNRGELEEALDDAFKYDTKILIEQAVQNVREFEVGVLGTTENPKASTVGEVVPSNEFYDYDAKYVDDRSELHIPAKISDPLTKQIQKLAREAFTATECYGMARVDFLYDEEKNNLYLSELNTIPGFTEISMYPKLWASAGLKYSELLDKLIILAIKRGKQKSALKTSYTPKEDWYRE